MRDIQDQIFLTRLRPDTVEKKIRNTMLALLEVQEDVTPARMAARDYYDQCCMHDNNVGVRGIGKEYREVCNQAISDKLTEMLNDATVYTAQIDENTSRGRAGYFGMYSHNRAIIERILLICQSPYQDKTLYANFIKTTLSTIINHPTIPDDIKAYTKLLRKMWR